MEEQQSVGVYSQGMWQNVGDPLQPAFIAEIAADLLTDITKS